MTNVTTQFQSHMMNLNQPQATTGGTINSSLKRKPKKLALWTEKHNETVVVLGKVGSVQEFHHLLQLVRQMVGDIKSHYFRYEQFCAFVYFHDAKTATNCKQIFNGYLFDGEPLKACCPSQFFENEEDLLATLERKATPVDAPFLAVEHTPILVVTNLPCDLKQILLLEFMAHREPSPQSISCDYDINGEFRGLAFLKYQTIDQATRALSDLQGETISGRKIKVEFKRRGSVSGIAPLTSSPPQQPQQPQQQSQSIPLPSPSYPQTQLTQSLPATNSSIFQIPPLPIRRPSISKDEENTNKSQTVRSARGCRVVGGDTFKTSPPPNTATTAATQFQLFPTPTSFLLTHPITGTKVVEEIQKSAQRSKMVTLMFPSNCAPVLLAGKEFA
eukprot:c14467_g1_i1.p1 GENE.c14467_g1_i1~~c14467_g1_i1.p1  ORF type:complete len:399 (+),score=73.56 c14467_g1_i1:36-1199(+)